MNRQYCKKQERTVYSALTNRFSLLS